MNVIIEWFTMLPALLYEAARQGMIITWLAGILATALLLHWARRR